MPPTLRKMVFMLFLLSSFVFIEPAPFDLFFVFVFVLLIVTKNIALSRGNLTAWMLLTPYLILSVISLFYVMSMERALIYFSITVYLCLLMFFIASLVVAYRDDAIDLILTSYSLSILISSVIGIATLLGALPLGGVVLYADSRLQGFFKDPNVFGPAILLALVYYYYRMTSPAYVKNSKETVFFAIFLLAVFVTYSRAAWAAAVLGVAGYAFLNLWRSGSRQEIMRFVMGVMCLGIVSALLWTVADMYGYTALAKERFELKEYDNDRFAVHDLLVDKAVSDPLGEGPGQTEIYLRNYSTIEGSHASHNTYVRVLFENGYLGALFFYAFMLYILLISVRTSLKDWKLARFSSMCTTLYLGLVLCGFVVDTIHWRHFWIVAGFILGLNELYKSGYGRPLKQNPVSPAPAIKKQLSRKRVFRSRHDITKM